jgi:hypothetical protein
MTSPDRKHLKRRRTMRNQKRVKIKVTFGMDFEKEWKFTLGMNFRGGMDEREFRLYFFYSIVPFFTYAQDVKGKSDIMKVDTLQTKNYCSPTIKSSVREDYRMSWFL